MRRLMITSILFIIIAMGSLGFSVDAKSPFDDLPEGHWAYSAISELSRLGFDKAYPEAGFIQGRSVTRYEMAWIVSGLLKWSREASLSPAQLALVGRLEEEFTDELTMIRKYEPAAPSILEFPVVAAGKHPAVSEVNPPLRVTLSDLLPPNSLKGTAAGQGGGVEAGGSRKAEGKRLELELGKDAKAELTLGPLASSGGLATGEEGEPLAALGIEYSLSRLARLRAGYELTELPREEGDPGTKARQVTSVGLDYQMPIAWGAVLKAGYTYSKLTDVVAPGASLSKLSDMKPESTNPLGKSAAFAADGLALTTLGDAHKTTTSLGLGYTIDSNMSLSFGYKLIDFTGTGPVQEESQRTNVTTAELEIRF